MNKTSFYIGCAGFYNKHWREVFYPPSMLQRQWYDFYCKHFNSLELNATFYSFPTLAKMRKWHDDSPEGFRLSVKAPRYITHVKSLKDCSDKIREFYDVCREGLGPKLGKLLFQLPPSYTFSEERLDRILAALEPGFISVVEFRHSSWWQQFVYDRLSEHGIIFCSTSYPDLPQDIITMGGMSYLRLHGIPRIFYSSYTMEEQSAILDVLNAREGLKEAFVYFNNTASQAGIVDAGEFRDMVRARASARL